MALIVAIGLGIGAAIGAAVSIGVAIASAVEAVQYNQQLASEAEQLAPKFRTSRPSLEVRDVNLADMSSFIRGRSADEQRMLKRLQHVRTSGKEHDYQFHYENGDGYCSGLLIVLAKDGSNAKIAFARLRIDFEGSRRFGMSSEHLNAIMEEYLKRESRALALQHVG